MNPATNYSNVGGGMPGGAKLHFPQNSDNQVIFNHAVQALQSQPPFTGWRADVSLSERAMKVYQMYVSCVFLEVLRADSIFLQFILTSPDPTPNQRHQCGLCCPEF